MMVGEAQVSKSGNRKGRNSITIGGFLAVAGLVTAIVGYWLMASNFCIMNCTAGTRNMAMVGALAGIGGLLVAILGAVQLKHGLDSARADRAR